MANPNIVNVTSIYGKTVGYSVTNLNNTMVQNSTSNSIYKINSLVVSNIDGTNAADISIEFFDNSAFTAYNLVKTVTVPADATLVVISKETAIYLEENDLIKIQASANGDLHAVCSYEIIS